MRVRHVVAILGLCAAMNVWLFFLLGSPPSHLALDRRPSIRDGPTSTTPRPSASLPRAPPRPVEVSPSSPSPSPPPPLARHPLPPRPSDPPALGPLFAEAKRVVEATARQVGQALDAAHADPQPGKMFADTYVNTLDTTTSVHLAPELVLANQLGPWALAPAAWAGFPDRTHVITGDIEAMWLRDSMGQVRPYLFGAHPHVQRAGMPSLLARAAHWAHPERALPAPLPSEPLQRLFYGWVREVHVQAPHRAPCHAMRRLLEGLILRQAELIAVVDPLSNAYRLTVWNRPLQGFEVHQGKGGVIAERKYELDSLCSFLQLGNGFFDQIHPEGVSGEEEEGGEREGSVLECNEHDPLYVHPMWLRAVQLVLHVMRVLQRPDQPISLQFPPDPAWFLPLLAPEARGHTHLQSEYSNPELQQATWHNTAYTGMTASGFRPSDDEVKHAFHVPSNMYAVGVLGDLTRILTLVLAHQRSCFPMSSELQEVVAQLREEARALRGEIERGIQEHAVFAHPEAGEIFCYETNGKGECHLMDDANVPSLLASLHYGYPPPRNARAQQIYQNTRRFVLSERNPFYVLYPPDSPLYQEPYSRGGIGSPHTPAHSVWPMSLVMQITTRVIELTQLLEAHQADIHAYAPSPLAPTPVWLRETRAVIQECEQLLNTLQASTAGTGLMHESFDASRPAKFTRSWFAWANSLYAEAILSSLPLLSPQSFSSPALFP